MKHEILVNGESITWAGNENPTREETGKFVVLQDKAAKNTYLVSQID